jgi:hypothetical protein
VRPEELPRIAKIIKESMESAVMLEVPLEVKLRTGSNWGNLEPYVCLVTAAPLSSFEKQISPLITSPVDGFPIQQEKEHEPYLYPLAGEELLTTHSRQVVKNLFGNE